MKRAFFPSLAAVGLLVFILPAVAQKYQPKTIQFKGAPEYSDQELLTAAGLKKGVILAYADMKDHSQRLMDTGLFETLSFKFDGEDLVYTLVPHAEIYPLHLDNLPLTPGRELDSALHAQIPLYHGKVPAEGGLTDQVCRAFEQMLAAQGIKARVTAAAFADPGTSKASAVTFSIAAPPVRVGAIHLEGVSSELQDRVQRVADQVRGNAFLTDDSASSVEHAIESFYEEEGYAAAKVRAIRAGGSAVTAEAIDIPFTASVQEGRLYKLGSIRLPSGELLTPEMINKAAGAISYKSGSLSEKLSVKGGVTLRTALLYVTGQYKSNGYMDCVITPHPQYDDAAGVVNYSLEVQPGPVYTMGNLVIQNSADDLRAAMWAAWKVPTGAVFSEKALQDYYSSQGNTALGRTFASAICKYSLARNMETHTVDVTLRMERKQ